MFVSICCSAFAETGAVLRLSADAPFNAPKDITQTKAAIPLDAQWTVLGGERTEIGTSGLKVVSGDGPCVLLRGTYADTRECAALEVMMRVSAGSVATLQWATDVDPNFCLENTAKAAIRPSGRFGVYTFSPPRTCSTWAGHINRIKLVPTEVPAEVVIAACDWICPTASLPRQVAIERETVEAFAGSLPSWRVTIPPAATFEAALGMPERAWRELKSTGVRFLATLEIGARRVPLLEREMRPATAAEDRAWTWVQADLAEYAGQDANLALTVEPLDSPVGAYGYWGDPVIFSSSGASDAVPVILVSCDTVRSDHLACYGYSRSTTPNLDAWTQEAVLFEQAVTTSTWTSPSHVSMLTGLLESHHLVNGTQRLSAEVVTLAEALRTAGYVSAGFTGNAMMFDPVYTGLADGFDVFGLPPLDIRDVFSTLEKVKTWLDAHKGARPFLFFHNFDVHHCDPSIWPEWRRALKNAPYAPGDAKFLHFSRDLTHVTVPQSQLDDWCAAIPVSGSFCPSPFDQDTLQVGIAGYDDAIRSVDAAIAELFQHLKALALYDQALIVVTADHGEEFGEHGSYGHKTVYEECCRVPLLIKFPHGRFAGRRFPRMVQLIDLYPTILDVLGIPLPRKIDGVSLLPALEQDAALPDLAWLYGTAQTGLRTDTRKFLLDRRDSSAGFFDLLRDPLEERNTVTDRPAECALLRDLAWKLGNTGWVICLRPGPTPWNLRVDLQVPEGVADATDLHRNAFPLNLPNGFAWSGQLSEPLSLYLKPTRPDAKLLVQLSGEAEFSLMLGSEPPRTCKTFHQTVDFAPRRLPMPAGVPAPPFERHTALVWCGPCEPPRLPLPWAIQLPPEQIDHLRATGYL